MSQTGHLPHACHLLLHRLSFLVVPNLQTYCRLQPPQFILTSPAMITPLFLVFRTQKVTSMKTPSILCRRSNGCKISPSHAETILAWINETNLLQGPASLRIPGRHVRIGRSQPTYRLKRLQRNSLRCRKNGATWQIIFE
jgi:hypothetical protein